MRKSSLVFFLLSILMLQNLSIKAQDIVTIGEDFWLKGYFIDPINKTVSQKRHSGSNEIPGRHFSYYSKYVDTLINFETTTLYVRDHLLIFKEYYKPEQYKITNDRPYHEVEGYNFTYGIYEKENEYFVLAGINPTKMEKIKMPEGVDFNRLNAVEKDGYADARRSYLYDKDGLYYLDIFNKRLEKVSSAKNSRPILESHYCIFNGEVFQKAQKIANLGELKETDMRGDGDIICISKGDTIFDSYYIRPKKIEGFNKWVKMSSGDGFKVIGNNLYFLSPFKDERPRENLIYDYNILFASPDSLFTIDCYLNKEAKKYNKVFIYNYPARRYEKADLRQFKLYARGFYVYRNKIHFWHAPVTNDFDMPRLRYLQNKYGRNTKWICDGKYLTHEDHRNPSGEGNKFKISFSCVPVARIKQLKMVYDDLLVDGVNFYQVTNREIQVIPIEQLGVKVDIDLSKFAYPYQ